MSGTIDILVMERGFETKSKIETALKAFAPVESKINIIPYAIETLLKKGSKAIAANLTATLSNFNPNLTLIDTRLYEEMAAENFKILISSFQNAMVYYCQKADETHDPRNIIAIGSAISIAKYNPIYSQCGISSKIVTVPFQPPNFKTAILPFLKQIDDFYKEKHLDMQQAAMKKDAAKNASVPPCTVERNYLNIPGVQQPYLSFAVKDTLKADDIEKVLLPAINEAREEIENYFKISRRNFYLIDFGGVNHSEAAAATRFSSPSLCMDPLLGRFALYHVEKLYALFGSQAKAGEIALGNHKKVSESDLKKVS